MERLLLPDNGSNKRNIVAQLEQRISHMDTLGNIQLQIPEEPLVRWLMFKTELRPKLSPYVGVTGTDLTFCTDMDIMQKRGLVEVTRSRFLGKEETRFTDTALDILSRIRLQHLRERGGRIEHAPDEEALNQGQIAFILNVSKLSVEEIRGLAVRFLLVK